MRRKFVLLATETTFGGPLFEYERFSDFTRLCRAAAYVRRFAANVNTKKSKRTFGELDAMEVDNAMLVLCRFVQQESFAKEYASLQDGRPIEKKSEICALKPFLDEDGLMRVDGRTDHAAEEFMSSDARNPILIPRKHHFTRLLAHYHHEQTAHQLINNAITAIRERFWVPQLRMLMRSVQAACMVCRKRKARPLAPVQGQLPRDRLTSYSRLFTNTGLDYFGPVTVTVGRRREVRYVALFTCLATRAVHLELAADASTDACLLCVRNLCHVRGVPSRIRCDNGRNFVGANNALEYNDVFLDSDVMLRELATRRIRWVFNVAYNPEAGGVWERLVQTVKRILTVNLKAEAPRVETLRAHLLEAANMLNSRPLTHLPVAPDEDGVLTPNHFLIGGPNTVTMACPTDAAPAYVKEQWRICRELSRRFWQKWLREYLPELTRRSKNHPERKELEIGDIVIYFDVTQPRGKWPMGKVVGVVIGQDGRVRSADVKTSQGTHRRPVTRLAALDLLPSSN